LDREPSGSLFRNSEFDDPSRWIGAIALSPIGRPTSRSGFPGIVARVHANAKKQNRARPCDAPGDIGQKRALYISARRCSRRRNP
jgi:hypothetical protein